MRIAVPITASSMDEALRDMDKAAKAADILELRIDYMQTPNLEKLLSHNNTPKIVTNRAHYEGGKFIGDEEARMALLQKAADLGAEYVDIEYNWFSKLRLGPTKLIVSYHDFNIMPNDCSLQQIYHKIDEKNPYIIKIATKANSHEDSLRMLNLISHVRETSKNIIGICMGDKGIITRIYGPVLGSYLTFAALDKEKSSAPGQLTVEELRQIWQVMGLKNKTD